MRRIMLVAIATFGLVTPAFAQLGQNRLLADANGDGKVSPVEYQNSRRNYLMKGDHDKDGRISAAEWERGAKTLRAELEADEIEGAELIGKAGGFAKLDANKDGYVTPSEINVWASMRFPQLDLDKNGSVNRVEAERLGRMARAAR